MKKKFISDFIIAFVVILTLIFTFSTLKKITDEEKPTVWPNHSEIK